jgi:hypothetical protein
MALPTYVAPVGALIAGAVGGYLVGKAASNPKTKVVSTFGYDPMTEVQKYMAWITDKDDWRKGGEKVAALVVELRHRFADATVKLARKIQRSDTFVKKDIFKLKSLVNAGLKGK